MKRNILVFLTILIAGSLFAQKAPTTKLISSSEESIVVQFDLNGFTTTKVMTPQGEQFIVNAPKMGSILEAGAPDLPLLPIPAIIGDRAEMTVNVIDAQYTDYDNMSIAPSKGGFSRQINPDDVPYTYGEMYQQNAFWPATQAYLEAPYIQRDFRAQNIMVRPFAYNPVTKTLRVYTHLTIAMTKVSDNGVNQKAARKSNAVKTSPEFKASYSHRFINFGEVQAKYPFLEDNGEMLVICADQFMAGMQPFVDWKNQSGRPTTMVSMTEVGGNNTDVIKSYISGVYNDPNHNLAYVLFVGDFDHITPHPFQYDNANQYSDMWFAQLEGNDYYPEVFIGRFSVQNDAHVANHVNKVLYYERDMQSNVTWGDKGLGIGHMNDGPGHYGEYDYQHIDLIRDTLLHYTYSEVTELHGGYGSGATASTTTISNALNQGVSIVNYCNHGSETSWGVAGYSTSNVNALTNDNMLPIVWSVACLNGKFNYGGANGECFAEAWMRATDNSTGAPTGAIGGMFSWISQPWQPPMYGQDEMVDILTGWHNSDQFNHTLSGASLNGSNGILDFGSADIFTATQHSWLLFGDPTLMVRTENPEEMNVTPSPAVLMVGMTELSITAAADYGIATLSMNGEVIATGRIINGECTLTFPALNNVGTADLVVMGYNKVTYVGTIEVIVAEGAYISMNNYTMSAEQANYGETIDMDISIKNVGVEVANNLTATLTTSSEYVEILAGEGSVASINPDEIVTLEGFQFSVAENVPDKTNAEFTLTVTDGNDTWEKVFTIQLHAPVLAFVSALQYVGQNDENVLEFSFKNTGSAPFYGGNLGVYSCSPDITLESSNIVFDDIVEGDQVITLTDNYTVDDSVEPGSTYEIAYELNSGLNSISGIYVLTYGAIQEDFESGVFSNDWTFSTQYPWTIVEGGTKGTKCASSSNANVHSSESFMQLTVDVPAAGDLTFMYKVSSEANYDKFAFYMDNQKKGEWSGTVDWTQFTQAVTVGTHTFKWAYTKDTSVSTGEDHAWVDDIVFPPTSIVTFLEPVKELVAEVNDRDVTLTWESGDKASSFLIKRDGEEIERTTETSYTDYTTYGTHTYSVFAVSDEGGLSVPTTIVVEVLDVYSVEDNTLSCQVYPNPVSNTLYIKGIDTTYRYALYNNMGQQVVNGQAQGLKQIDVNSLAKGVYFLRITNGAQTSVQKVVVE